ncbi:MAG: RNA polymerase factor sigma-32 [Alphaproteobacteria bacterium]
MSAINLPILSDNNLSNYLDKIKKFPVLTEEQECSLIKSYKLENDVKAAHAIITSHLRLVVKIAMGFRGYGLPLADLVAEGNIGLMQALKKFDCKKGFRFSTYAIWWVKAAIQEYILKSWSIIKIGTSATQKKLFYNLRKIKNKILNDGSRNNLLDSDIKSISTDLNVSEQEVISMDNRFSHSNKSLDAKYGGEDSDAKMLDFVEDTAQNIESMAVDASELSYRKKIFAEAIKGLNERELDILRLRQLVDSPLTLEDLSKKYNISRERVRQIETKALEKVKSFVEARAV